MKSAFVMLLVFFHPMDSDVSAEITFFESEKVCEENTELQAKDYVENFKTAREQGAMPAKLLILAECRAEPIDPEVVK